MKKMLPPLVLFLLVALFVLIEYGDKLNININWNFAKFEEKAIDKPKVIRKGAFVKKIHYGSDPHRPIKWKVNMKYNEKGKGIRHGESIRYWESGEVASRMNYVEDVKEGNYIAYYKNGKVWKEQIYLNGNLNGECKHYDRSGRLTARYEYKNDMLGTGLVEFTNLGKKRKQPVIKMERIDEMKTANRYTLNFSLGGENVRRYKKVTFYLGDLIEGKYFQKNMSEIESKSPNTATMVFDVPKGTYINKTYNVVAVAKNSDGLRLVLTQKVQVGVRGI